MATISPALKVGLGVAAAAAAFSLFRGPSDDMPLTGETFESPLALVDEAATTPTTWGAPPVTRNPFTSGQVDVDESAIEAVEPTTVPDVTTPQSATDVGSTAGGFVTTSTLGSVSTTEATGTLEETVSRRVPPGAPPVSTPPTSAEVETPTTGLGGVQLDG